VTALQELYTVDEVAASRKVSPDYIRRLVKAGKVRPFRTSDARNAPMRFGPQHLAELDAAMTPTATTEPAPRRRRRRRT
jgi:hypothetical protein